MSWLSVNLESEGLLTTKYALPFSIFHESTTQAVLKCVTTQRCEFTRGEYKRYRGIRIQPKFTNNYNKRCIAARTHVIIRFRLFQMYNTYSDPFKYIQIFFKVYSDPSKCISHPSNSSNLKARNRNQNPPPSD